MALATGALVHRKDICSNFHCWLKWVHSRQIAKAEEVHPDGTLAGLDSPDQSQRESAVALSRVCFEGHSKDHDHPTEKLGSSKRPFGALSYPEIMPRPWVRFPFGALNYPQINQAPYATPFRSVFLASQEAPLCTGTAKCWTQILWFLGSGSFPSRQAGLCAYPPKLEDYVPIGSPRSSTSIVGKKVASQGTYLSLIVSDGPLVRACQHFTFSWEEKHQ